MFAYEPDGLLNTSRIMISLSHPLHQACSSDYSLEKAHTMIFKHGYRGNLKQHILSGDYEIAANLEKKYHSKIKLKITVSLHQFCSLTLLGHAPF